MTGIGILVSSVDGSSQDRGREEIRRFIYVWDYPFHDDKEGSPNAALSTTGALRSEIEVAHHQQSFDYSDKDFPSIYPICFEVSPPEINQENMPSSKGNPTDPELREKIKEEVKNEEKG